MSHHSDEIKICALMLQPYDISPGQRFRLEQWEPYLRQENIKIDYFPFADDSLQNVLYEKGKTAAKVKEISKALYHRFNHVLSASKYDVVYLYRTASIIGPALLERLLHFRQTPLIFDFDDSIFITNSSKQNSLFGWTKFSGKTATICRLSSTVTVGNSFLAEYARHHNENVVVVPTSIDINQYSPVTKPDSQNGRVVIGWTGSSTSQYYLEAFEDVLIELKKQRDVEILVVSNREPEFKSLTANWQSWSPENETATLSAIDIGIMPLPDNDWSRGKCALKAMQYMALGIPAICSDVGANRDLVSHGENGFLAATPEDWLKYFKILIDDAELRRNFGVEARKTIVENFSMTKCAKIFGNVVRQTVANHQSLRK